MFNQITSIEEFMQNMHDSFQEALHTKTEFELSITYLHPADADTQCAPGVYECMHDQGVPFRFERIVLPQDIMNVFGYMHTSMEGRSPIDRVSIMNMENRIQDSFEDDMDRSHMDSIMGAISQAAHFMGTYKQFRVKLFQDGHIEYSLLDGLQVFADTATMEQEQAKELGIEKEITPSDPNRWIQMGAYTVTGIQSL